MIEVKNLVKDYGGHMAVDQLSFTIKDGQIYGFLGPNGAGKSTTMNIMTGYIGATHGDVLINGHNILEEPEEAKKCIGYLPEQPPLYIDMTVKEQLEFAAELKKIPKKERANAIAQVVELAKLDSVYGRLIRNLSKGYRQRVGLAQAVLGMPPVIILDEPTVGLDPKQIIEIRDTIRQLGRNHTVILSSHILSEVSAVCDHIMIIDRGKLIASDTPENLEEQMAGTAGMELLAKGSREEIESILKPIKGLEEMKIQEGEEPGVKKITFRLEAENSANGKTDKTNRTSRDHFSGTGSSPAKEDVRERIFFAFADQHIPLLSMRTLKVSLEEVFLRLTAGDVPVALENLTGAAKASEPVIETDGKPAEEQTVRPGMQTSGEPGGQPAGEQAGEPGGQPAEEQAEEPGGQPAGEADSVSDSVQTETEKGEL